MKQAELGAKFNELAKEFEDANKNVHEVVRALAEADPEVKSCLFMFQVKVQESTQWLRSIYDVISNRYTDEGKQAMMDAAVKGGNLREI